METTLTKIENIEAEKVNNFIDGLAEDSGAVYNSKNGGLEESLSVWFKHYAISDDFANLSKESKLNAFKQFEDLGLFLHKADHFFEKNRIGIHGK